MINEYRDWNKSWRNHLYTLGAITLMSLGTSLYGYKNIKNIDRSLANHSLEETVVTSLEDKRQLYKSIAVMGGYVGFLSMILGLSVLNANPGDP